MNHCFESSLYDLYTKSLSAFPDTKARQNRLDQVDFGRLKWVPFDNLGTLLVKGSCSTEDSKNDCSLLFKKVSYKKREGRSTVSIPAYSGAAIHMLPVSLELGEVLVRCSCPDFRWRFAHWNGLDGSLFGESPKRYKALHRPGSSNPSEEPGLCKHIMKMAKILLESGVLRSRHKQIWR